MKRVILFFATLLTFSACQLNEIEFEDQMYYDDVYGKWRFYSASATQSGCSWIEFTEGRYFFAYKSDDSIVYGKYSKTGNFQFTLDGFATIDVSEYSSDSFTFGITFDGAEEAISASAYIGSGAVDDADEDSQYDDNIYAVWEYDKIPYYTSCGCTCGDSCSCQSFGYVCTTVGCNCLCNENRTYIKYMLIADSGTLITIYSNGDTAYDTWHWQDYISTDGIIFITNNDNVKIEIKSVASQSLEIYYTADRTDEDCETYEVWFTCKSSGQLEL